MRRTKGGLPLREQHDTDPQPAEEAWGRSRSSPRRSGKARERIGQPGQRLYVIAAPRYVALGGTDYRSHDAGHPIGFC